MTAGERAYRSLSMARAWSELSDDERATWELGASLPPVGATLTLVQEADTKVA